MDKDYRKKYQLLKKRVKDMIFENAALCDQVSEIQESVSKVTTEKQFLLQRLHKHEPDYTLPVPQMTMPTEKRAYVRKKSQNQDRIKFHSPATTKPVGPPTGGATTTAATAVTSAPAVPPKNQTPPSQRTIPIPATPLESSTNPEVDYQFQDDIENSFAVDNLVIQSLGEIDPTRPNFHSQRWIYPLGFTTIRIFGSMANPFVKSVYTCRILEDGDSPRFEMSSEADPEVMIVGPSPQFCLTTLLNYLRDTHGLSSLSSVKPNGNWFFGLAHPVIMGLLEAQPGFRECTKFLGFLKVDQATIQERENDPGIYYESFIRHVQQHGEGVALQEETNAVNNGHPQQQQM